MLSDATRARYGLFKRCPHLEHRVEREFPEFAGRVRVMRGPRQHGIGIGSSRHRPYLLNVFVGDPETSRQLEHGAAGRTWKQVLEELRWKHAEKVMHVIGGMRGNGLHRTRDAPP